MGKVSGTTRTCLAKGLEDGRIQPKAAVFPTPHLTLHRLLRGGLNMGLNFSISLVDALSMQFVYGNTNLNCSALCVQLTSISFVTGDTYLRACPTSDYKRVRSK